MKTTIYAMALAGVLALSGAVYADHDPACKKVHGTVSVVTTDMIAVDDKPYKIGKSTRLMKGEKKVRINELKAGDVVCVDARGKDDIGDDGEIAAITILTSASPAASGVIQKEIVREKVSFHDKNCPHVHARVSQVNDTTLVVNGQPLKVGDSLVIKKGDQLVTVDTLKAGDIVCLNQEANAGVREKVTTVLVLDPSESFLVPESQVIERERIQIR